MYPAQAISRQLDFETHDLKESVSKLFNICIDNGESSNTAVNDRSHPYECAGIASLEFRGGDESWAVSAGCQFNLTSSNTTIFSDPMTPWLIEVYRPHRNLSGTCQRQGQFSPSE